MKMRSVVRDRYGPPTVLTVQEVFRPVPKDNEILIKIEASTVNRTEYYARLMAIRCKCDWENMAGTSR